MKLTKTIAIGFAVLGFTAAAVAEDIKINVPGTGAPAAAAPASKIPAPASFSEAQVLEMLGWMAGKGMQLEIFKLNSVQLDSVLKGVGQAAMGKDTPYDQAKIGPLVQEFAQRKQAEYLNVLKQESTKESAAYFATLKDNKAITELPSGLRYEIVQPGTGAYPKLSDTVKVHYTGKLVDGTVFDSSAGKDPVEFPLDGVILGWTEGIQKINKGGKIRLHVPANLAYGDEGRPGIPPGSALVFDVELLEFKPSPGPASIAPTK